MSDLAHRHTIHRDHIHHGWNNAFAPALKIAPGESVEFETLDASSGQLNKSSTAADLEKLDLGRVNPVTGPVWIDGAMPGDALKVTILSLRPSGWGWTGNIPGFGLLTDQFPNARLHHWNYDPRLAPAMFGPGGRVPLRPFTGTIGVAPGAPGLHSIIPPRNVGGNMDFYNMLERERLESKKISKTQAVTSNLQREFNTKDVHIGPSDHVGWLDDRKWAYVRLEGRAFDDVPLNLEYKLEVWDSPNSAGVIIDAVRAAMIAKDRGIGGPVNSASSYFMKSPPVQYSDDDARQAVADFIAGTVDR